MKTEEESIGTMALFLCQKVKQLKSLEHDRFLQLMTIFVVSIFLIGNNYQC